MAIDLRSINPDFAYPLKEVAQILGISYGTVLKLKKEAKVKWIKIGGKYYVQGSYLLEYINQYSS